MYLWTDKDNRVGGQLSGPQPYKKPALKPQSSEATFDMKYVIYIVVLGAFVGTSVQRPPETTSPCTQCTEGLTEGTKSPSSPLPELQSPSSSLPVQELPSSSLPGQACQCQLGSIRRKRQCREYPESLDHSTAQGWGDGQADWSCLPHVVEPK